MSAPRPRSVGPYRIDGDVSSLGPGGAVYAAYDAGAGRPATLRTVPIPDVPESDRAAFEERVLAEVRAAAELDHPAIVATLGVGLDHAAGSAYVALEPVAGRPLDRLPRSETPLDWGAAFRLAAGVAEALSQAHARGIVHGGLSPADLALEESGRVRVQGFGFARLAAACSDGGRRVVHAPGYLSPEHAMERPADARGDLFSLGAILYELVTGRRPFEGPDVASVLVSVAYEEPPPPSAVVAGVPAAVDAVLARALAKSAAERYPSADRMAADLLAVADGRPPELGRPWPEGGPATLSGAAAPAVREATSAVPAATAGARPGPPSPTDTLPPGARETSRSGTAPTLSLPRGRRVSLAILDGPCRGQVFAFERPQCLIGRSGGRANAHIELPDPEVSRTHALVECHGHRVLVRDLDSTNGTFFGLDRIRERGLDHGDEFRVGGTRLMLIVTDGE